MIYVSAQRGNDANAGTFADPLREISAAVAQSAAAETIVVLDSGQYSPFTIDKALTIAAECAHAEVVAPASLFGNAAITVNAGATDVVVLRGLSLKGMGGTVGIWLNAAKSLRVENCTVSSFVSMPDGLPGYGIQVYHGELTVKDSVLRDNTNGLYFSSSTNTRGIIDHCRLEGTGHANGSGVQIMVGVHVTIARSLVTGYANNGIYMRGAAGAPVPLLTLINSTLTHNRIAIYADRTGQVHLVSSTVTLNSTGLFTLNGGVIYSAGNNAVIGNLLENIAAGANVVFFKSDVTVP